MPLPAAIAGSTTCAKKTELAVSTVASWSSSFGVSDRMELERWEKRLDQLGVSHGDIHDAAYGSAQAKAAALKHYPYEASDTPFRGLVFHDEAWKWPMREVYGDRYWVDHPELATPSAEYRALG